MEYEEIEMPERFGKAMVESINDLDVLHDWYEKLDEIILATSEFIDAKVHADIDDEDWFARASSKLAHSRIAIRWVERRILKLGDKPDYPPTDPRTHTIRTMSESIMKLKARIVELEKRAQA